MPMDRQTDALAEVYAQSLFELTQESGGDEALQQTQQELEALVELTKAQPDFAAFLHSRVISVEQKQGSLRRMFADDALSDLVLRFLLVLNDKERLYHLAEIGCAFTQILWAHQGRIPVDVYSAEPMDEEQLEQVRLRISAALGKDPILTNRTDPAMIGGLKLRIGDRLIDASVATRLRNIRQSLTGSGAEAIRARFSSMLQEN